MRIVRLQLIVVLLIGPNTSSAATPMQQEKATSPKKEIIRLFNGTDLTGWYSFLVDTKTEDPRQVFTVADKMIRISGDGFGYLSTKQAYKDYHLVLEYKWGKRNYQNRIGFARDSGVFLHSVGPDGNSYDGNGAFKAAIECQIMEGSTGDFLLIKGKDVQNRDVPVRLTVDTSRRDSDGWPFWDPLGKTFILKGTGRVNWRDKDEKWQDKFGFRAKHDLESPLGEWTRLECLCTEREIRIFVNGRFINEVYDVFPHAGKILLQCEGSEIFFRKIELHPLNVRRLLLEK